MAQVFESLGIPKERLEIDRRARNTQENAEFAKAIAAQKNGERWLLVTSAYHMPRSVGLFRKVGFAVEPYPVDWRVGGRADLLKFWTFSVRDWEASMLLFGNGSGLWRTGYQAKPANSSPARTVAAGEHSS